MQERVSLLKVLKMAVRLFPEENAPAYDMDIPDNIAAVYGEEIKLSQVINHLIRCAAEPMAQQQQPVILQASNIFVDKENNLSLKDGSYVKITIESKGTIISPDSDGPVDMGLFLSYAVVKKLHGNIFVESDAQRGSVLSIYLPAVAGDGFPTQTEAPGGIKKEKKKVLLLDDDPLIVEITSEMLEEMGYLVESFREGSEVLIAYKRALEANEGFDVVVLDIFNRLGMDGKQTLKNLIEIDPLVKAIGITGYLHDVDIGQLKQFGFQKVISKPYKIEDLMDTLKDVLTDQG
jgi:two-component system cell cycle sensor histidine kinase/response regulator CckA